MTKFKKIKKVKIASRRFVIDKPAQIGIKRAMIKQRIVYLCESYLKLPWYKKLTGLLNFICSLETEFILLKIVDRGLKK